MSIRLTRVVCKRRVVPTVIDFAAESRSVKANVTHRPRGRFQWWKEPIYYAPHVYRLQRDVDFTLEDGRPIFITSKDERERKLKQIKLGEKVVELLGEINESEVLYAKERDRRARKNDELKKLRSIAKGDKSIC